jgi:Tol biopolymer transport system component
VDSQERSGPQQLTDDPAYRDEYPLGSADGSFILFVRLDAGDHASVWLVPAAGGEPRQIVDELSPATEPAPLWFGYYGHVDWDKLLDWWRGPAG